MRYFDKQRNEVEMRDLTRLFKALSDPNRLRIIAMLAVRPLCVCEITAVLGLSTSTVSKHLSILRDVDLILDEKDGKWVNYSLNRNGGGDFAAEILPLVESRLDGESAAQRDRQAVHSVDRHSICGT